MQINVSPTRVENTMSNKRRKKRKKKQSLVGADFSGTWPHATLRWRCCDVFSSVCWARQRSSGEARGNGRGVTDTRLQVWHLIRNWSTDTWTQAGQGGGGHRAAWRCWRGPGMMRGERSERWACQTLPVCVECAIARGSRGGESIYIFYLSKSTDACVKKIRSNTTHLLKFFFFFFLPFMKHQYR